MKPLMPILVGAALVIVSQGTFAVVTEERVSRTYIAKLPMDVAVQTNVREDGVHFTFTVRKKPDPSRYYQGSIKIRKDKTLVVECPIHPTVEGGTSTYEFVVAPGFLDDSDFDLFHGVEEKGTPLPGGQQYHFNLQEFSQSKAPH